MTKADLVEKVAQDCNLSKAAAEQALNSVLGAITNAVATGDKVALFGFGTFSVSDRAAREGRNPKTGEVIQIAAGKVVRFKAGKILANAVRGYEGQ
jgi:DNA-binding protein HU-beta